MEDRLVMGIDLGTSGVKVVTLDEHGRFVGQTSVPLAGAVPRSGWSEQAPDDWIAAAFTAIRQFGDEHPGTLRRVQAIAAAGQMHGAVLLDGSGAPLRPAILWNDQRSAAECEEITNLVGIRRLVSLAGNPALAGFTAPKLLWVRRNEPLLYARTRTVLLPKDYLNLGLSGVNATEPSDASGTLLFDVWRQEWSTELLNLLDLNEALLPPVSPSAGVIGGVTPAAASATGLKGGTPVVAGGSDNGCAALGLGIVAGGDLMVSLGTSGTVLAATGRPPIEGSTRLHAFCHVLPGTWYSMGVVLSAGASLRWFRDSMWPPGNSARGGHDVYDDITSAAAGVDAGCDGLLFLPYLSGERTPHADPSARGVFFGLSLRHERAHLARAVIEGVTFALRESLTLMDGMGTHTGAIRVTGGGARSPFWLQMLADVFGKPVRMSATDAGPALGAAMLAGAGAGVFKSAQDAAVRLVTLREPIAPSVSEGRRYLPYFDLFRTLYPALRQPYESLSKLAGA